MLRRNGFRRRERPAGPPQDRETRLAERAARASANVRPRASVVAVMSTAPAPAVLKDAPVRSQAYRRAVASLPCKFCGVYGYSQCAHANTGKGAGLKTSDLDSFPLCACRLGQRGCHSLFDQGALLGKQERRAVEPVWIAETQGQIRALGLWPKSLPYPPTAPES